MEVGGQEQCRETQRWGAGNTTIIRLELEGLRDTGRRCLVWGGGKEGDIEVGGRGWAIVRGIRSHGVGRRDTALERAVTQQFTMMWVQGHAARLM